MGSENITLIGDDATIEEVTFGAETIGDAVKTFDVLAGVSPVRARARATG